MSVGSRDLNSGPLSVRATHTLQLGSKYTDQKAGQPMHARRQAGRPERLLAQPRDKYQRNVTSLASEERTSLSVTTESSRELTIRGAINRAAQIADCSFQFKKEDRPEGEGGHHSSIE